MTHLRIPALGLLALVAACLAACGPADAPAASPAREVAPEPGRTIPVTPPGEPLDLAGWRIVVVGDAADLVDGARGVAEGAGAELSEIPAGDDPDGALAAAIDADPDLVVGVGEGVVDAFSFETAQRLDRDFLLLGAQLAEPTANVTAVIWEGATSRGSAASADGDLDPASATPARGADALAAGIASIRAGETGIVLDLDD